jgi:hypothetical protein
LSTTEGWSAKRKRKLFYIVAFCGCLLVQAGSAGIPTSATASADSKRFCNEVQRAVQDGHLRLVVSLTSEMSQRLQELQTSHEKDAAVDVLNALEPLQSALILLANAGDTGSLSSLMSALLAVDEQLIAYYRSYATTQQLASIERNDL